MPGLDVALGIVQGLEQARETMLEATTRKEEVAERKRKSDNQFKIDKLKIQQLENELDPEQLKRENERLKAEHTLTMGYLDQANEDLTNQYGKAKYEYDVASNTIKKAQEFKGKAEDSETALLDEFSRQKAGSASEESEGGFLGIGSTTQKGEIDKYLSGDQSGHTGVASYLEAIGSSTEEFQEWASQNYPDVYKNAFPAEARMRSKRGSSDIDRANRFKQIQEENPGISEKEMYNQLIKEGT